MKDLTKSLLIEQMDKKLQKFVVIKEIQIPPKGWINAIRVSLNMSLKQLGKPIGITSQSVREIESREADKKITLEKLIEVGSALNLHFVYGFIPKDGSLEKMIEKRAYDIAEQIVLKTSHSMALENQENPPERINKAIKDRAEKIKYEMPRYLWD